MKKLPSKLSDLLDLAVTDAQKVLRRKKFSENMNLWYVKRPDGTCTVCLAGAVICNTLGLDPPDHDGFVSEAGPGDARMTRDTNDKLWAINNMRIGEFLGAFEEAFGDELDLTDKKREALSDASAVVQYSFNAEGYLGRADWRSYRKAAKILRAAGL